MPARILYWWKCKVVQTLWKTISRFFFFQKFENRPTIWLLKIYSKEVKLLYEGVTCISIFIAAQGTLSKTWTQHRCASADNWIKKAPYAYAMAYYSATNRMKACLLKQNVCYRKCTTLGEITSSKKARLC